MPAFQDFEDRGWFYPEEISNQPLFSAYTLGAGGEQSLIHNMPDVEYSEGILGDFHGKDIQCGFDTIQDARLACSNNDDCAGFTIINKKCQGRENECRQSPGRISTFPDDYKPHCLKSKNREGARQGYRPWAAWGEVWFNKKGTDFNNGDKSDPEEICSSFGGFNAAGGKCRAFPAPQSFPQ